MAGKNDNFDALMAMMAAGFMFKFPRAPEDDACIVETYMR